MMPAVNEQGGDEKLTSKALSQVTEPLASTLPIAALSSPQVAKAVC